MALLIAVFLALRLLALFDWDPTVFTAFGEDSEAITGYAEEKLRREVLIRPEQGHDGKFFFVQANDPLLLHPDANAEILDRPLYSSQRMLFPLIAGAFGLFPPNVVIWAMPVVNVLAFGLGSWAVARIAMKHGAPAWVGIGFVLNLGLLRELFIDGAGVVAFALACLGALALEEEWHYAAAAALTGAVLAREAMAIFVAFIALFWLIRRKSVPWLAATPAAVALIGWAGYVRLRLDDEPTASYWKELDIVPFKGVVDVLRAGGSDYMDYVVLGIFLALMVLIPYRSLKSDAYITWGAVGFAVLGPFLTWYVWQRYFDISRALAPLATVFLLELVLARQRRTPTEPSPAPQPSHV